MPADPYRLHSKIYARRASALELLGMAKEAQDDILKAIELAEMHLNSIPQRRTPMQEAEFRAKQLNKIDFSKAVDAKVVKSHKKAGNAGNHSDDDEDDDEDVPESFKWTPANITDIHLNKQQQIEMKNTNALSSSKVMSNSHVNEKVKTEESLRLQLAKEISELEVKNRQDTEAAKKMLAFLHQEQLRLFGLQEQLKKSWDLKLKGDESMKLALSLKIECQIDSSSIPQMSHVLDDDTKEFVVVNQADAFQQNDSPLTFSDHIHKAIDLYSQAVVSHPGQVEAFAKRAECRKLLNQFDLAIRDASVALMLLNDSEYVAQSNGTESADPNEEAGQPNDMDEPEEKEVMASDGINHAASGNPSQSTSNHTQEEDQSPEAKSKKLEIEKDRFILQLIREDDILEGMSLNDVKKKNLLKAHVLTVRGSSLCFMNELSQARKDYIEAHELDSSNQQIKTDLALLTNHMKSVNLFNKGSTQYKALQFENAIETFSQALSHHTKTCAANVDAGVLSILWVNRAACHLRLPQNAGLHACYEDCSRGINMLEDLVGHGNQDLQSLFGKFPASTGSTASAFHSNVNIVTLRWAYVLSLVRRGTCCAWSGRFSEAIADYTLALRHLEAYTVNLMRVPDGAADVAATSNLLPTALYTQYDYATQLLEAVSGTTNAGNCSYGAYLISQTEAIRQDIKRIERYLQSPASNIAPPD
jgi:tetratricopeptide (TPR) repeat protein